MHESGNEVGNTDTEPYCGVGVNYLGELASGTPVANIYCEAVGCPMTKELGRVLLRVDNPDDLAEIEGSLYTQRIVLMRVCKALSRVNRLRLQ